MSHLLVSLVLATLRLVPLADGTFAIERNGVAVVSSVRPSLGPDTPPVPEVTEARTNASGRVIYNAYSRAPDCRWRFEAAERDDGVIELTLAGDVGMNDRYRMRLLKMTLPNAEWQGKSYRALKGNCRQWIEDKGTFDGRTTYGDYHFLAANGLVLDFCPQGGGEYYAAYGYGVSAGVWNLATGADGIALEGGGRYLPSTGTYAGTKVTIREGDFEDYDRIHFLRVYHYRHLPLVKVCEKFGPANPRGAAYSAKAGRGEFVWNREDLMDGFYVLDLMFANPAGLRNRFAVKVNGEEWMKSVAVERGKVRQLSRAVEVVGGKLQVKLAGDYLISRLALQPILARAEDFSIARGWWVVDGYEPGTFFRNCDFAPRPVFPLRDESYPIPRTGEETRGLHAEKPLETCLPDPDSPELQWLKSVKMTRLFSNQSTLAELDDPTDLKRYFDQNLAGKNAIMLSGMHSRHTYTGHLDRGVEAIRRIVAEAHRRNLKVFDHHDATLLWNICGGFRTMLERLPEVMRDKDRFLPCYSFCPNNRTFKAKYLAYLRRLVEAGVDGFQIDELEFWAHGCTCADCREAFRRDTGGELPFVDAQNPLNDKTSELYRRWYYWRQRTITDWFIELRKYVMDLNPKLVINMYITHDGFYVSGTRRNASYDLIDLGRAVNYFGTEVMTRNPLASARALPPLRKMKASLSHAYGTPLWAWWYAANRPNDYFAWAVSAMNGEVALLSNFPKNDNLGDYMAFGDSERAMGVGKAKSMAKLALVFSESTRDWGDAKRFYTELLGLGQELEALHVPYDIICERSLTADGLEKYSALALGAADQLPAKCRAAIADWQARGGRLIETAGAGAFFAEEVMVQWKMKPEFMGQVGTPAEAQYRQRLRETVRDFQVWRTDAPDKVYTALWEDGHGGIYAHFLNATREDPPMGVEITTRPPAVPYPPIGRDIAFAFPFRIRKAMAVSPDFEDEVALKIENVGKSISKITLPQTAFKVYTLVRMEKE